MADHDDGDKTFLGETGRFNGEEIIAIIARQEATARFISPGCFSSSPPTRSTPRANR